MERAQEEVKSSERPVDDRNLMKVGLSQHSKIKHVSTRCGACGDYQHNGKTCPAKDATCHKCNKIGHFARKCSMKTSQVKALNTNNESNAKDVETNESVDTVGVREINYVAPRATIDVLLNGVPCRMEFDSGARLRQLVRLSGRKFVKPGNFSQTRTLFQAMETIH